MAKITKQRVEKCLNDLTDLGKDLIDEKGLFDSYDSSDIVSCIRNSRATIKYAAERALNKTDYDKMEEKQKNSDTYPDGRIKIKLNKAIEVRAGSETAKVLSKATKTLNRFKKQFKTK